LDITGSVILTFGTACLVLALAAAYEGAWLFALVSAASCWISVAIDRRRDRIGRLDAAGAVALALCWFAVFAVAFCMSEMSKRGS